MLNHILLAAWLAQAYASPLSPRAAVTPKFKSATYLGNVTDPALDRDSCGSVRIGTRAFWTCRDTMVYNTQTGQDQLPIIVSTAGWTDAVANTGGPAIKKTGGTVGAASNGKGPILQMYGNNVNSLKEYFPIASDNCNTNHGFCSDGSRWAIWPDSPPLVTASSSSSITAYNWIPRAHIQGLTLLNPSQAYSLYRTTYTSTSNKNTLPTATLVATEFWKAGEIGFGDYGGVVKNGYAYLYGQNFNHNGTFIARVPTGSVEKRSAYQYYNASTSTWSSTLPSINDTTAVIPNAGAGGQGTFYYSNYYKSYIWLGQAALEPVANFYISTAPAPEGPWILPYKLWQGQNGNGFVGAYSLQANPALLPSTDASENAIYLTYTQPWTTGPYVTPLVYLTLQ
ncbi:hypothetical protein M409DRAFT_16337 [Zasmidium cellare ATCC 36951]|uniref:Uncharacterized protein n=1 Tax=Zasmidium cellare ATCC 36951 TaxID=1080233 RepID=A0A6A6D4K9_ZASCE|nr:uncharacterized protein M409DRAFT_16337 [Zasmidium cellare ATCC 36951]KAF2174063.1 hypothetical protein M409DRAFT_16337 [Zasmidium cellare ATCC 36951]